MSEYLNRRIYLENIAHRNMLVGHNVGISGGATRKSFHKINDEEELNTACQSWGHYPCVVHMGHSQRFKKMETGLPRRIISTDLMFLSKTNLVSYPVISDAIDAAFDQAATVMEQFISYMKNDYATNGPCGTFYLFDLSRFKATQVGPINQTLYGWHLYFEDEAPTQALTYDNEKWYSP